MVWTLRGITGEGGEIPEIAGQCSGRLLVCGCGPGLWRDMALAQGRFDAIMAVNDAIALIPQPLTHAASVEHRLLGHWAGIRGRRQRSRFLTHCPRPAPGVDHVWRLGTGLGGTSALFAALVGLCLGYGSVLLAGVPLSNGGHFWGPPAEVSRHDDACVRKVWRETALHVPEFRERVRSLSGWTRDLLGDGVAA